MLYILYGNDTEKSRAKRRELKEHFMRRVGALGIHEIHGDGFDSGEFENLLRGSMLFREKHAIVGMRLLENKDAEAYIVDRVELLARTPHLVLLWEEHIAPDVLEKFKPHAKKMQAFRVRQIPKASPSYKPPASWREYQIAVSAGSVPAEIFWRLWWAAKRSSNLEMLGRLVEIYHNDRRGVSELPIELERLLLDAGID